MGENNAHDTPPVPPAGFFPVCGRKRDGRHNRENRYAAPMAHAPYI